MRMHQRSFLAFPPFLLPIVALVASCANDMPPPSGPPCGSSVWMETAIAPVATGADPSTMFTGQCLSRSPNATAGVPSCIILEGHHEGGACPPCDATALRQPVSTDHAGAVGMAQASASTASLNLDCFCEIPELSGSDAEACQSDTSDPVLVGGAPLDGVCYVDATTTPPIGDPTLASACPANAQHFLRFLGKARLDPAPQDHPAALFILCEADDCSDSSSSF